jgi:hypothetical protein
MLTASAGNAAFNPRASVPASSVSSLLPSAAAAVAAQSGMQQRFSTQTGSLSANRRPPTVPSCRNFQSVFCFVFSNSLRSHAPPLQCGKQAVGTARRQPHRPNAAGSLSCQRRLSHALTPRLMQGVGFSAASPSPVPAMGAAITAKAAWRAQR